MKKVPCCICNGTGKLPEPLARMEMYPLKVFICKDMRRHGYSIREIQKLLKYKSPRSVQKILDGTNE
jgi:hypothetical protein